MSEEAEKPGEWYRVDAVWRDGDGAPVAIGAGVIVRRMFYRTEGGEPELAVLSVPMGAVSPQMSNEFVRACEAALRVPVLALSDEVRIARLVPITKAEAGACISVAEVPA
jgi:hypothetical protein